MSIKIKNAYIKAFEEIAEDYERGTHRLSKCKLCHMTGRFSAGRKSIEDKQCLICPEMLFVKSMNPTFCPCVSHGVDTNNQPERAKYLREVVIPKVKKTHANSKCFTVNELDVS